MAASKKTDGNGSRDPAGRFLAGGPPGPGRPRGISFRRLVTEVVGEEGVATSLMEVFAILKVLAVKKGDVQAAKILIDKLCVPDAIDLKLSMNDDEERPLEDVASEISKILQAAAERRAQAKAKPKGKPAKAKR